MPQPFELDETIILCVLCGIERHNWINPYLDLHNVMVKARYGSKLRYMPAIDFKSSQEARNWACDRFLEMESADRLLMVDNDTLPLLPIEYQKEKESLSSVAQDQLVDLVTMARHDVDIVSALCPVITDEGYHLNAYFEDPNADEATWMAATWDRLSEAQETESGLLEVDAVGTGAIMLKRNVVEKMKRYTSASTFSFTKNPPFYDTYFLRNRNQRGETVQGEDLLFCYNWKGLHNGKVHVDTYMLIDHLHTLPYLRVPTLASRIAMFEGKVAPDEPGNDEEQHVTYMGHPVVMTNHQAKTYYDLLRVTQTPPVTGMSARPGLVHYLQETIKSFPSDMRVCVLEFGSGVSSLAMIEALANRTTKSAFASIDASAEHRARVNRCAATGRFTAEQVSYAFVDAETPELTAHLATQYHLLFIDGPDSTKNQYARQNTLPSVWKSLAPGCKIVIDDYNRASVKRLVGEWMDRYGIVGLEDAMDFATLHKPGE